MDILKETMEVNNQQIRHPNLIKLTLKMFQLLF